jgi:hypothetical protein
MAFTPRQHVSNAWQSATSASSAYSPNPLAGNLLLVLGECNSNQTLSISDTNSHTWIQLFQDQNVFGTQTWAGWYAVAKAGACNVTVSSTGSPSLTGITISEFNCAGVPTLDKNPALNTGSGTTASSNASGATGVANELLIGFMGMAGGSIVAGGAYTKYGAISFSGTDYICMEYDIVNATSSYTATATGTSGTWAGHIATFKDVVPAGGFVQAATNTGSGNTTATLAASVTAGDSIVVIADSILSIGTVTSVTDGVNTYTMVASFTQLASSQQHIIQIWTAIAATNVASLAITANSSAGFILLTALEYGASTTFVYDKFASANNGASTSQTVGPTGTTSVANEVVISYIATQTGFNSTFTANAPYTKRAAVVSDPNFGASFAVEDNLVSSTGAQTGSFTLGSSISCAMVIVTFALTTPPPPPSSSGIQVILMLD